MPPGVTWQVTPGANGTTTRTVAPKKTKPAPKRTSGYDWRTDPAWNPGGQTGPGKTGGMTPFQKWLASTRGTSGGGLPTGFDPKDFQMPDAPELTAYPEFDYNSLPDGSDVPTGKPMTFKPGQARLLNPTARGNAAQAAYQPIIDAITKRSGQLQSGVGSANKMLDSAFGASSDAALRGAQIVSDSNQKSNASLTDLAARLAGVAGGDPTAAAAVGGVTADQQVANSRFAGIAEQTQADQAAAAQRDLGTAKLAYRGATDQSISDLAQKGAEARTQGRQDSQKAIMDALGFNSDQQSAQLNRDVSKQEAKVAGLLAGVQVEAGGLANAGTRQTLGLNKRSAQVNDWSNMNDQKMKQYAAKVTALTDSLTGKKMMQELKKGNTPAAELALADDQAWGSMKATFDQQFTTNSGPEVNPGTVYTSILHGLHKQYPASSSTAIKALATRYASQYIPMWNARQTKTQNTSGKTWKLVNEAPALVKKSK